MAEKKETTKKTKVEAKVETEDCPATSFKGYACCMMRSVGRYLSERDAHTWIFFLVGMLLGGIFF